jgi:hypothetical protein
MESSPSPITANHDDGIILWQTSLVVAHYHILLLLVSEQTTLHKNPNKEEYTSGVISAILLISLSLD